MEQKSLFIKEIEEKFKEIMKKEGGLFKKNTVTYIDEIKNKNNRFLYLKFKIKEEEVTLTFFHQIKEEEIKIKLKNTTNVKLKMKEEIKNITEKLIEEYLKKENLALKEVLGKIYIEKQGFDILN